MINLTKASLLVSKGTCHGELRVGTKKATFQTGMREFKVDYVCSCTCSVTSFVIRIGSISICMRSPHSRFTDIEVWSWVATMLPVSLHNLLPSSRAHYFLLSLKISPTPTYPSIGFSGNLTASGKSSLSCIPIWFHPRSVPHHDCLAVCPLRW